MSGGGGVRGNQRASSLARTVARISFLRTFPTFERGRSGQISTCFGALTLPMRALTKLDELFGGRGKAARLDQRLILMGVWRDRMRSQPIVKKRARFKTWLTEGKEKMQLAADAAKKNSARPARPLTRGRLMDVTVTQSP